MGDGSPAPLAVGMRLLKNSNGGQVGVQSIQQEQPDALMSAIVAGELRDVEQALASGSAEALGPFGMEAALLAAVKAGSADIVAMLLPFSTAKGQSQALVSAAGLGRTSCAELLIAGANPNEHAGSMRQRKILFDTWTSPHPSEEDILTPLCMAAAFGSLDCVKLLLASTTPTREHAAHALGWAAQGGNVDCAREILPFSDAKAWDSGALQRAAARGNSRCVELLIPASCPEDAEARALCLAADNGHSNCVGLLLPVSGNGDGVGRALVFAASMECEESLRLILSAHPDKALFVDDRGFTALMRAAMVGSERCVKILAPLSDLEMRSPAGESAMDIADSAHRESRHPKIAEYLRGLSFSREEARALEQASSHGARALGDRRL